jgi:hypothetical protein
MPQKQARTKSARKKAPGGGASAASAAETPTETPDAPLRTPEHGNGQLRVGNPGNKGGGRTPDEFKQRLAELASSDQVLTYLESCLVGAEGPKAHIAALQFAAERGYGRVPQALQLEGNAEKPLVIEVVRK